MRYLLFAFVLSFSFAPAPTHAAFGFPNQIVPLECKCDTVPVEGGGTSVSAPAFGCVLQTVQNVVQAAIAIGFIIATLALIYAGFVWMTSSGKPGKVEQGKHLLLNTFIGLFVMLGAWLLVDFVMKTLYREPTEFGPWNNILVGNEESALGCLTARRPTPVTTGTINILTNPSTPGGTAPSAGGDRCSAIPDSSLVAIDNSGHRLTAEAAQRFNAMKAAAARDGITLIVTSAYRSPEEQLRTFIRNGCQVIGGRSTCSGTVGTPCQLGGNGSNHSRGTAVDISLTANNRTYQWLRANGCARFHFCNNLPRDLVHWSDTGA